MHLPPPVEYVWGRIWLAAEGGPPAEDLRALQDSLGRYHLNLEYLRLGALAAIGLLAGLLIWRWIQMRRVTPRPAEDHPQRLFDDLLARLDLSDADHRLLQELVAGARLRHPVMCLLSPGLLEWSARVWRAEKGPQVASEEKMARLRQIAVQLYDHHAPINAEG
jgi:hypothetical protein